MRERRSGRQAVETGQVVGVHGEQQVERVEVRWTHLPRTQVTDLDAVHAHASLRPCIGGFACMMVDGAGTVRLQRQAPQARLVPDEALRHGTAADVPHADEEDLRGRHRREGRESGRPADGRAFQLFPALLNAR